jgi:hypothetical protein
MVLLFAIGGIVTLSLLYLLLWMQLIGSFKLRTTTDFVAFYAAGWIARYESPSQVYNLDSQRVVEEHVSGSSIRANQVNPFVHPPFVIPLISLLITPDFVNSYENWAMGMLLLLMISSLLLIFSLPYLGKMDSLLLFLSGLLFFPGMVSLLNGQDSAILLLGAAIWFYGLVKGKFHIAGIGLALTTIRPQISIILAFPFLFKLRRIWWWYCGGIAVLAATSILIYGVENVQGFLRILTVSASGEGYLINERAMVNLLGLLRTIFPGFSPNVLRYAIWLSYLVAIVGICLLWLRANLAIEYYVTLAVIISIFFSPHFHYHDLVLLLLPLFGIMRILFQKGVATGAALALSMSLLSLFMLLNHLIPLFHVMPYVLMMGLPVFGFFLTKKSNQLNL